MADFKTHTSAGAVVGIVVAMLSYISDLASHIYVAVIVFFATIVGSFLPDMDSDSGTPVKIIFGLYSLVAASLAFYFVYENYEQIYILISAPVLAFVIFRYLLPPVFKRFTKHRGAFHSFPAFLISFFAALLIADLFSKINICEKFVLAAGVSLGYLSHLVLDEIYASNFFTGKRKKKPGRKKKFRFFLFPRERLKPKKSFGTALDLALKSKFNTVIIYAILGTLIYLAYPIIEKLYRKLF